MSMYWLDYKTSCMKNIYPIQENYRDLQKQTANEEYSSHLDIFSKAFKQQTRMNLTIQTTTEI